MPRRTIRTIAAHLHNARSRWLRTFGKAHGLLDAALQPVLEPGKVTINVGASSRDIRLRGTLEVR